MIYTSRQWILLLNNFHRPSLSIWHIWCLTAHVLPNDSETLLLWQTIQGLKNCCYLQLKNYSKQHSQSYQDRDNSLTSIKFEQSSCLRPSSMKWVCILVCPIPSFTANYYYCWSAAHLQHRIAPCFSDAWRKIDCGIYVTRVPTGDSLTDFRFLQRRCTLNPWTQIWHPGTPKCRICCVPCLARSANTATVSIKSNALFLYAFSFTTKYNNTMCGRSV